MDLDELRDALDEAGARTAVDVDAARGGVDARAGLRRRRRIGLSLVAVAAAVALIAGTIAVVSNRNAHKTVDIQPTAPPPVYGDLVSRAGAALAYDDALGKVVLFGGANPELTATWDDTWLWDGHGWSQVKSPVSPPAREGAVMAYDPATKQVVMFGGTRVGTTTPAVARTDTWTFDGRRWTQQRPTHVPPWSNGVAMSFDPKSKSVLLLTLPSHHPNITVAPDGFSGRSPAPFGTWRWTGSDWAELTTPTAPLFATNVGAWITAPRLTPLANGAGLLFYSWALPASDLGSCPAPGTACEPQPDPNGTHYSQTWTWDGTTWTEQHPTRAPKQSALVVTPGPVPDNEPTVFAPDGPAWTWTGSDWRKGATYDRGPQDDGFAVYDRHDDDVVAYAQRVVDQAPVYDTWTWKGTWNLRTAAPPPPTATNEVTTPGSAATTSADPLPAGALMLEVSGGTINLLDATGKVVKTLVTASAGQTIVNAQLLEDHRTLWYATKTADNLACPAIMKLDLQTNVRTIEGQADDFSITPDGAELLLVWPASATSIQNNCRPLPYPSGTSIYAGAFVMRNLATGISNTLPVDAYPSAGTGGPTGHVLIVQAANVLIDSICDANSCTTHSYSVPMHRAGLITEGGIGPACDCPTLVAGPDGYYGATFSPDSGAVVRYAADYLAGSGTVRVLTKGVALSSVAPTASGVYVLGVLFGAKTTDLYRIDTAGTPGLDHVATLGPSTTLTQIFPIPPFN